MTNKERHVLEHTTGWRSANPLFRNHFVAGEGHDDWETLQELCRRGLMRVSREPSEISGGDPVFAATESGIAELRQP
jgi:hypothetical protein